MAETGHPETTQAAEEHLFWMQVLEDHARLIYTSLAASETRLLVDAHRLLATFATLHKEWQAVAAQPRPSADLSRQSAAAGQALLAFTQHVIDLQLTHKVQTQLAPAFLSHMISTTEEYLRVVAELYAGQAPTPAAFLLHHHMLWLTTAAGHAALIRSRIDPTEHELFIEAHRWKILFDGMHQRTLELMNMLRRDPQLVPPLNQLSDSGILHARAFKAFLIHLQAQVAEGRVLGAIPAWLTDHMLRTTGYYADKLQRHAQLQRPEALQPSPPEARLAPQPAAPAARTTAQGAGMATSSSPAPSGAGETVAWSDAGA